MLRKVTKITPPDLISNQASYVAKYLPFHRLFKRCSPILALKFYCSSLKVVYKVAIYHFFIALLSTSVFNRETPIKKPRDFTPSKSQTPNLIPKKLLIQRKLFKDVRITTKYFKEWQRLNIAARSWSKHCPSTL